MALNAAIHAPKHWHCAQTRQRYQYALDRNEYTIAWEQHGVGTSTKKQFGDFLKDAQPGDILFLHCSKLPASAPEGGESRITHWGRYNGEMKISKERPPGPEWINDRGWGQGWNHTIISVDEWVELPRGLAGQGLRQTLYEVSDPDSKNYINYTPAEPA
jgi:hypothetical protein